MIFNLVNPYDILKLNVISGTVAPGNAAQGTIFIETDVPHTSYVYSTEKPTNPTQGMVWIQNGEQINRPSLAFKKRAGDSATSAEGNYYVSPINVVQYLDGKWVNKNYYIYDENEEIQDNFYYVMSNRKFNPLYSWDKWVNDNPGEDLRERPIEYQNGVFQISDQSGYYYRGIVKLSVPIDVTNYNNMVVNVTASNDEGIIYCGSGSIYFKNDYGVKNLPLENVTGLQTLRVKLVSHGEGMSGVATPQLHLLSWHFE